MMKPAGKTVAPSPLSQHLHKFASNPHTWAVLARSLIPVIGIHGFGWSAGLTVFNYWFDGLTALAAILAALVPRAIRETQRKSDSPMVVLKIVRGVLTWISLVGIVGRSSPLVPFVSDHPRLDGKPRRAKNLAAVRN